MAHITFALTEDETEEIPDDFQPTQYGVQWMDDVGDMHLVPWSAFAELRWTPTQPETAVISS